MPDVTSHKTKSAIRVPWRLRFREWRRRRGMSAEARAFEDEFLRRMEEELIYGRRPPTILGVESPLAWGTEEQRDG